MKKFSNITGQKVSQEPKKEVKIDEAQVLKSKMISLMNQFLSISFHGSNDYRLLGGGSKIKGQEMLAEAILDLLNDKTIKETTKLLESLKSEVSDWKAIDEKIEQINKTKTLISNRNKINSLLEKYSDSETLLLIVEKNSAKINNIKTLNDYIQIISENNSINSEVKTQIVNIYQNRIKQLSS
jgi:hypothetical protein